MSPVTGIVDRESPAVTALTQADAAGAPVIAFRTVFEAESAFVWNLLRRFGVPPRDLEDVTHDVFMTVYRRFDDYDRARPVRPWLFGIAYRVAARYRELARNQREVLDEPPEPPDDAPRADEQLIAREARETLDKILDTLDLDRRAVFVLHDIEGCTMPDIAAALAVPLNTAYSRLRLAREQVKTALHRLRARGGEA
jgi:RNA polymerase sigma-70 factor (ECF subfamily)